MRGTIPGVRDLSALRRVSGPLLAAAAGLALTGCAVATPDSAPVPSPSCAAVTAPFDCGAFRSTDGSDATGSLAWLASDPITVVFVERDSAPELVILTACNTIDVPVAISSTQIVPNASRMTTTTMGCASGAVDHEEWTTGFFSAALSYTLAADRLTLVGSSGTVSTVRTVS